ncbi:hypothetical protein U9M48_004053, partial [Paspalum notatum var. saurae]
MFFYTIVRLHGIPCSMVSDCDQVSTSNMWSELFNLTSVSMHLISAFHPQRDGQSEVTNSVLGLAKVVAVDRDVFLTEIRDCQLQAQDHMKEVQDKDNQDVEFQVGDR